MLKNKKSRTAAPAKAYRLPYAKAGVLGKKNLYKDKLTFGDEIMLILGIESSCDEDRKKNPCRVLSWKFPCGNFSIESTASAY